MAPRRDDRPPLTLGTAGHIDHGKTALVNALTGRNTDRLPEERSRGISIELGYAPLDLPSGRRLSVVDVPGHERFVRTMVAGASGVVAITKADLGEPELAAEEAAELVPGAPVVPVSALTRDGVDALRAALDEVAAALAGRAR